MKDIKKSSIIICSIVRNAEKGLVRNIPVIKSLCQKFADYKIIVYENDSTDKTKKILQSWMDEDKTHVVALLNNRDSSKTIPKSKDVNVNPFFSYKRIERMATLRNQYMKYIEQNGLVADYLMVVDLDVAQLFLSAIMSSFGDDIPCWDAVTAYGYSTSPSLKRRYHDTYALVELNAMEIPQTEKSIKNAALSFANQLKKNIWIQVDSAFGGLAIYRFECIKGLHYQVLTNNDDQVEVKCEHQSIYQQMRQQGYKNIFVNPQMLLKYQDLTLKVIWNSIIRKFSILSKSFKKINIKKQNF